MGDDDTRKIGEAIDPKSHLGLVVSSLALAVCEVDDAAAEERLDEAKDRVVVRTEADAEQGVWRGPRPGVRVVEGVATLAVYEPGDVVGERLAVSVGWKWQDRLSRTALSHRRGPP